MVLYIGHNSNNNIFFYVYIDNAPGGFTRSIYEEMLEEADSEEARNRIIIEVEFIEDEDFEYEFTNMYEYVRSESELIKHKYNRMLYHLYKTVSKEYIKFKSSDKDEMIKEWLESIKPA